MVEVPIITDKRGPVVMQSKRVCVDLPPSNWLRTVVARVVDLPMHTGAGPCGTSRGAASGRSYVMWWSVHHLVAPIRAYYATYEPPMRFGAKPGPRGRRAA